MSLPPSRAWRCFVPLTSLYLLAVCLLAELAVQHATPTDVVWYISSVNGSTDIATCGRTIDTPCRDLQLILEQSMLFDNTSTNCQRSVGGNDGRNSTTLYFLEGVHFVPPVCLTNWFNLRIIGLGEVTITSRDSIGAPRAFFEFRQCSNISIENVTNFDTSFIGKSTLYFETCSDIRISNCVFPVIRTLSTGVIVQRSKGVIEITDSLFVGNSAPDTSESYGLSILHGCESGNSAVPCFIDDQGAVEPIFITIRNTNFTNFTTNAKPNDRYSSTRSTSIGMRIRFLEGAVDSTALIDNVTSSRNAHPAGSHMLINFDSGSSANSVRFVNCKFKENRVRYGGGLAAYFYGRTSNNCLTVEDSKFLDNVADFEGGGVFVVYLQSPENNAVLLSRNKFERNQAYSGAGVFLFNSPNFFDLTGLFDPEMLPLVTANISDCSFTYHRATTIKEGIISTLRMQLYISGVSRFSDNTGSAVLLRNSLLYIDGTVMFIRNKAEVGAAINILEGSRVDMSSVIQGSFLDNKAAYAGGAIYADSASTAHLASEYNHTQAQSVFGSCFVTFGNERQPISTDNETVTRFLFSGNRAVAEGHTIHSFSMRGCIAANFLPEDTSRFLIIPNDGTVMVDNELALQTTSTGPSKLFFYGASTRCYKTVGSTTYLFPNCSHDLINKTISPQPDIQCGLKTMDDQLRNIYGIPGTGFRPTMDKLIYPWVSIEASWTLTPSREREQCEEVDPARLYLSPAPGEQFDLTIQLADQFQNYISTTVYMELQYDLDQPPGVLIQLNGLQYAYNERVYFTPNRAVSGLALVGLPGTEGQLKVVADSQVADQKIELSILFKLAQCPLGYYNPPGVSTVEEVNSLIMTNFSTTQRIPTNQPLACHCFSSNDVPVKFSNRVLSYSHQCLNGYTIELNSLLWAGLIPTATSGPSLSLYPPDVACPPIPSNSTALMNDFTSYVHDSRRRAERVQGNLSASFDPLDVIPYASGLIPGGGAPVYCFNDTNVSRLIDFERQGEFSIEVCSRGYCRGDLRDSWFVANVDYPCVKNRQGPLCGQCKPGYAVTLYSTVCRDCTYKTYHPWLALIFTVIFGLVLVAIAVTLNLGVSPTLDSLLFFIQATMVILSGRTDYEYFQFLAFFNPDFTFNMCITPDLDGLSRLAFQYITPFYILILLFFVLLLTCVKGCSKYLGRHSFLQALWLLLLISYINIAITSYELLHCRVIGPVTNGTRDFVLVHDASIMCYKGVHLPWAIIALFLLIFFVIPFPIVLVILMYIPKFKPIVDVYCSPYKDRMRWWVLLSILRRLILVVVGVFIQDYVSRHFGLLITVCFILLIFMVTWPYQSSVDNYFAFLVTWMILLTTVVTQPELYLFVDPLRAISATLVIVTIFIGIVLLVFEQILKRRGMTVTEFVTERLIPSLKDLGFLLKDGVKQIKSDDDDDARIQSLEGSTHSSILPRHNMLDATAYREPLLDSSIFGSGSINGDIPRKTGGRRNPLMTLLGRNRSSKADVIEEESSSSSLVPTSLIVGPDSDNGYFDSGFVRTKTADTNDTNDTKDTFDTKSSRETGDSQPEEL